MNDTMRVWVYDGPHASHIETRPRPVPGPSDVRIRIALVGICGSDLHGYTGESGRRAPGMIMGHEASGWVEAVGSEVSGLAVGDTVTFNPALPCDGSVDMRVRIGAPGSGWSALRLTFRVPSPTPSWFRPGGLCRWAISRSNGERVSNQWQLPSKHLVGRESRPVCPYW